MIASGTTLLDCGPSLRGWSNQEDILVCPYRWALKYLRDADDVVREPAVPLVRGSLVHVGLAHFWSRRIGLPGLLSPRDAVAKLAEDEDRRLAALRGYGGTWQPHVALAQTAVEMYERQDPYRALTPIAVEHHVSLFVGMVNGVWVYLPDRPADADLRERLAREGRWREFYALGAPWLTTFRTDLLAKVPSGRVAIVDHKTGFKNDQRKQDGFLSSGQMIQFQHWGALAYGEQFDGVHVGFVNLRDLNGARAFESFRVVTRPEMVLTFPAQVGMRAEFMRALLASEPRWERWPRALVENGTCAGKYGDCALKSICCGGGA